MEITIKKTVEEKQTVQLPLFFKNPYPDYSEYIAIISEQEVLETCIFSSGKGWVKRKGLSDVTNSTLTDMLESWPTLTREEFESAWNTALQSLSLKKEEVNQ